MFASVSECVCFIEDEFYQDLTGVSTNCGFFVVNVQINSSVCQSSTIASLFMSFINKQIIST